MRIRKITRTITLTIERWANVALNFAFEPFDQAIAVSEHGKHVAPVFSPVAYRFFVTDEPVFDNAKWSNGFDSFGIATTYASYKLDHSINQGDKPYSLFVWDTQSPSGVINPVARFDIINGKVVRR